MNQPAHVAPHEPSPIRTESNKPRHLVGVPTPTYRLLERLAVKRGVSKSDTLYAVLRDALHAQEDGDGWAYVPPPFSINPAYMDGWIGVALWNPFLPPVVLSGKEACQLAEAIHQAVESADPIGFELTTGHDAHRIYLSRGPAHIALHIDGDKFSMVRPVATDVAAALESASVHTAPVPKRAH